MTEVGTVVERTKDGEVVVEVGRSSACDACHAKGACFSTLQERRTLMTAIDPIGVEVGDRVTLELDDRTFLRAVAVVYMIPLLMLIAGAAITYILLSGPAFAESRDLASAGGALVGVALGVGIVRLYNQKIQGSRSPAANRFKVRVSAVCH